MCKIILVANEKGGCCKTTVATHLAWAADELGFAVLSIDTDTQGAMFRRLSQENDFEPGSEREFGDYSTVTYTPLKYAIGEDCELIIVDTKGNDTISSGPVPDIVIIPVSGYDALREANSTIYSIRRKSQSVPIVMILVSMMKHETEYYQGRLKKLPKGVSLLGRAIDYSEVIKESEKLCQPAWEISIDEEQAIEIKNLCYDIFERLDIIEVTT